MFVIIGASGYLGSYLIKNIINHTNENIIATNNTVNENIKSDRIKWVKLDISDKENIKSFNQNHLKEQEKYKFIYLASYHHPDKVEANPSIAWDINVASLDYFLNNIKSKISALYYSSTDSVYGESIDNKIFFEDSDYNPVNTYGRTKAIAEQIVLMHGFSVLRYSLLMGPSLINRKHFFDIIIESLQNKQNIDMYNDSSRSIISFDLASYYSVLLLDKFYQKKDIINITSDDYLSKFDMAVKIAKKFNLDDKFITPASINKNNDFGSKRAQNTLISNKKLKNILKLDKINFEYA
jgi:dTDP-4-dehydrorhamnose reductase